jgi:hypothetical protein
LLTAAEFESEHQSECKHEVSKKINSSYEKTTTTTMRRGNTKKVGPAGIEKLMQVAIYLYAAAAA